MLGPTFPDLKGRTAVVTGGSTPVGAMICRLLGAAGARVAAVCDEETALQEVVDELRWIGADAVGIVSRAADETVLAAVRASVLAEFGVPELLFASTPPAPAGTGWHRAVECGLTATFLAVQTFVPDMVAAGAGAVVTLAPVGPDATGSAVGGGIAALTHHIAREVAVSGVRANVVSWTPSTSMVEDVAFAALYLASDAAGCVNATTLDIAGRILRL